MAFPPPPAGGEDDVQGDLVAPRRPTLRGGLDAPLLAVGILFGLLVWFVAWIASLVYTAYFLERHGLPHDPAAAVFIAVWLVFWIVVPVWSVWDAVGKSGRRSRPDGIGSGGAEELLHAAVRKLEAGAEVSRVHARRSDGVLYVRPPRPTSGELVSPGGFFFACWAILWVVASIALLRQRDVLGFLVASLVTGGVAIFVLDALFGRQTVSLGPVTLESHYAVGPFGRTRRYELRLIHALRAERCLTEDGPSQYRFQVAFQYRRKTVRFGRNLDQAETRAIVREMSHLLPVGADAYTKPPRSRRSEAKIAATLILALALWAAIAPLRDKLAPRRPSVPSVAQLSPGVHVTYPPAEYEFASLRDFASALTVYSLTSSRVTVMGQPGCSRVASAGWSCTVLARATTGPYSGRPLTYHCFATYTRLPSGRRVLDFRYTHCRPTNAPPNPTP